MFIVNYFSLTFQIGVVKIYDLSQNEPNFKILKNTKKFGKKNNVKF